MPPKGRGRTKKEVPTVTKDVEKPNPSVVPEKNTRTRNSKKVDPHGEEEKTTKQSTDTKVESHNTSIVKV